MDINYNVVSIIDILGFVQGILFGILLILGNRKSRPSWLLGVFLITYSIEVGESILNDTNILQQKPELLFLPLNFYFLSLPVFYLYAKSLTSSFSLRKHLSTLIPGGIEFLFFLSLFLLPSVQKQNILADPSTAIYFNIYIYSGLAYSMFYAYKTIKLINHHQKSVLNYFSNLEQQQLKWVKVVAVFILVFYSTWFTHGFIPENLFHKYIYPLIGAVNVLFIYWVGISGLRQPKINMISDSPKEALTKNSEKPHLVKSTNIKEDQTYIQLVEWMEKKELYKEPDLTLPTLAEQLNVTRRSLSQLINQKTNSNFNRFINQYRVEAAKKILTDPKYDHLNMLGIAFEVGFNSKATFFAVFKHIEGVSPGAYKKQFSPQS